MQQINQICYLTAREGPLSAIRVSVLRYKTTV